MPAKKFVSRELLETRYITERKTAEVIAVELGITRQTIYRKLRRYGIPVRSLSEAKLGTVVSEETKAKHRVLSHGSKNGNWKGGRRVKTNKSGTQTMIYVWSPNHPNKDGEGYVTEHRLAVEKVLGRYLRHDEDVHHINFDETDNRNENLLVCSHGYHTWLHRRIEIAKDGMTRNSSASLDRAKNGEMVI